MYLNSTNRHFHGIMLHHFHDGQNHPRSQGSISKDDFVNLIKFIGRKNILNAQDFLNRLKEKKLKGNNVCLTFDDGSKGQFDIAFPIMEDLNIKAFFFVYSNIYEGTICSLEIYRYFRMNCYRHVDDFYHEFYKYFKHQFNNINLDIYFKDNQRKIQLEKNRYPVYTHKDIEFRFVRNDLLNEESYKKIMLQMFKDKNFNYKTKTADLFINKKDLKILHKNSHLIGLHSYTHPQKIENLTFKEQLLEYQKNKETISEILESDKIVSMSHPGGSYNQESLKVLKNLNIEIGFDNVMKNKYIHNKVNNSNLEISREDHSVIMKRLNN